MELFDVIGSYGPWQRRVFLVFFYLNMVGIWQNLAITFLAPNMDFRCIEPPSQQLNSTVFDKRCEVLVSNVTTPCTRWEYDTSYYSNTIVSEWDLVCDRQWLVSLSKSIYMFGYLISVILFGQMSDWVGRYPAIVVSYLITLVSMFLPLMSTSYTMFAVLRFFQALGRTGLCTVGIVLMMELTGPKHNTQANLALQVAGSVGFMSLAGVAWFVRHWYWLQVAMAVPIVPLLLAYRIIPESPRWLIMRGKKKQLERLLKEAVSVNGKELNVSFKDMNILKALRKGDDTSSKNLFHLMRMPKMRNRTFIMIYLWMVNAFMYYGLSYNTNDLAGDPYLNFFISGAMEVPSYILLYWAIKWLGRRPTLVSLMFVGGLACLSILAVPDSIPWLQTAFAMTGKFCVTGSFGLLYVYTNELFPTVVRNVSLGSCSMCARIGSILAPFVRELGKATHSSVPNVLYGVLALTSGLLALPLPETRGRDMPDTMEEGEAFGKLPLKSPLANGIPMTLRTKICTTSYSKN